MNAPDSAAAPIRPAATVILLRELAGRLEVLLIRRSAQLAFMGDVWVFPGGRLDETDLGAEARARVFPAARDACATRLATVTGEDLDQAVAVGLHVAGCRETFEECGVLLARRSDGSICGEDVVVRLQEYRAAVETGGRTLAQVLQAEDLYLDIERLVYWSHWITPSHERKRYDTRFFAIEVPAGQEARVDRTETTEHAWVTVAEAFARSAQGSMKLAPPTLATLQDLAEAHERHGSLGAMLANERGREVPPILPKWVEHDGRVTIVLPWDPEYAALPGEAAAIAERYPPHLARLPSRRELRLRASRG